MTFFPEPLKPSEGREDDEYRVNPIEADRHARESFDIERFDDDERKKRGALYGSLLIYFKKFLDRFDTTEQGSAKVFSNNGLPGNLQQFKALLAVIQHSDQSKNSRFCQQLSEVWIHLVQDMQVSSISKRTQEIDLKSLTLIMTAIEHYPEDEQHKLGHYLSNYAGESWLPIPFRDILKGLHSNHLTDQKNGTLSQWIRMIEDLLHN
ncbi:MAG: hypothetical protein AAGE99_01020 [Chlamydiota bacterium]